MRDDALSIIACGSSAAMGLPSYLAWLRQETSLELRVLLTHSAQRFVQPQLVAWYTDEFFTSDDPALNPTELALRSLGIVVLPATAHMLASVALGLAGSPAQTAVLSSERPALFFPNMNESMWSKPVVRRHVETLRQDGHTVVEPLLRPTFSLWKRENTIGPSMPGPDEATETIISWLEATLPEPEPEAETEPALATPR
jgi:phosphopantothenoylcysteine synthetase/decarboxylase